MPPLLFCWSLVFQVLPSSVQQHLSRWPWFKPAPNFFASSMEYPMGRPSLLPLQQDSDWNDLSSSSLQVSSLSSTSTAIETPHNVGESFPNVGGREMCASPTDFRRKLHDSAFSYSSALHNIADHTAIHIARPTAKLIPILPTDRSAYRYYGQEKRTLKDNVYTRIPRLTRSFTHHEPLPPGWTVHSHPDGQLYFYYASSTPEYITDANLYDEDVLKEVEMIQDRINEGMQQDLGSLPDVFQVVIHPCGSEWQYYMVDHTLGSWCIFWLHDYDASNDLQEVKGLDSPSHLKHYMDYQYWSHWELYPHCINVDESVLKELSGILIHSEIDTLTSTTSNAPYSPEDLHTMLSLVKEMHSLLSSENGRPYIAVSAGRLMSLFSNERYLNFHGQPGARQSSEQTIHDENQGSRTLLISILSPLLFFAPDVHLRGLNKVWVDHRVVGKQWKRLVQTLKDEWTEFILYATVLLTANVSFLAIPSVDDGSVHASVSQIASLLSIIASIGSVILGLLLVRHHRTRAKETAEEAASHIQHQTVLIVGLEPLAIMYSLPYAFLMWGMVTFLIAMVDVSFQATTGSEKVILVTAWTVLAIMVLSTIYANWEKSTDPFRYIVQRIVKCFVRKVEKEAKHEFQEIQDRSHTRWRRLRKRIGLHKRSKRLRSSPYVT